jgi:hypothetical protein
VELVGEAVESGLGQINQHRLGNPQGGQRACGSAIGPECVLFIGAMFAS